MMARPAIVWFRQDLRLTDNPALHAAVARGATVVPLFIWAPDEEGRWAPGAAARWWLHQSLSALDSDLRALGSRLLLLRGPSLAALRAVLRQTGATAVFWNRRYEPAVVARDAEIERALRADGVEVESANAALLVEPWQVATKTGGPYQVFTPFWRACRAQLAPSRPLPRPQRLDAPTVWPPGLDLADLRLEPAIDWAAAMRAAWTPGEDGAHARLEEFARGPIAGYAERRDVPGEASTSRLSPHLHFGEIGPRQIWQHIDVAGAGDARPGAVAGAEKFLAEVGWREFAHHLLFHFPETPERPLRSAFAAFPWANDAVALRAWQRGQTGYPIVDAGLRELWATGWMHNRVRMIVASFLVKDLRLPWQDGAAWFWETLVDADLASNTLGWQWTAGCGADAAPYFRVFNPITQGEKFDPRGTYVRRWVPELRELPDAVVHKPWTANACTLAAAGVALGSDYPRPIVDHAVAREQALAAFARLNGRE